jgi:hypothetical protein
MLVSSGYRITAASLSASDAVPDAALGVAVAAAAALLGDVVVFVSARGAGSAGLERHPDRAQTTGKIVDHRQPRFMPCSSPIPSLERRPRPACNENGH